MNIQTLSSIIDSFQKEIIDSGFKRDILDYTNSLSKNQDNIVVLREISTKIAAFLDNIYHSDLPERLTQLLPDKTVRPFTEGNSFKLLTELRADNQIEQSQFFQKLHQIITQLNTQIQQNETKINEIDSFIKPYITKEDYDITDKNRAIVSVIFKETKTISNLKYFTRSVQAWNRILPIYHQILKSSSPEDIEILEVQNGSIDFVFNFDFDIALNLVDLFKEAFKYYFAYLAYKNMAKPIAQTFFGNKSLLEKQKEIEDGMLDNIEKAIEGKIKEQHKAAKKLDKKIDDNIENKIEPITRLVASHIINGNDVRILSLPENEDKDEVEDKEKGEDLKTEIRRVSLDVRNQLKNLPAKEMKKLLERYGKIDNEDE